MVKTKSQITKIAKDYAKNLSNKGIKPSKIVLYGSYASGKANKWSDLDFVVISSDFKKVNYLDRLIMLAKASSDQEESIEAFGYTPDEISDSEQDSPALWDIARKTGKVVYSK